MVTETITLGDHGASLSTTHDNSPLMVCNTTPEPFFIAVSFTYPEGKEWSGNKIYLYHLDRMTLLYQDYFIGENAFSFIFPNLEV